MYDGRSKNMKTTPHNGIDLHIIFQKAHVSGTSCILAKTGDFQSTEYYDHNLQLCDDL